MKQIIVYIGVAAVLSLTACNDSFLERSPQSINDKTFWNTPSDLEAYVTPAARWGETADLQGPAVFLASEASDFVNGHVLYVDGGILAYIGKQP